jgi:hypothetical protein
VKAAQPSLLLLLLALPTGALADEAHRISIAKTTESISIDGVLSEVAWQSVEPVTEFLQYRPNPGGPAPGRTEVYFLQDEQNLYIGVRVSQADYEIRARISPRESINEDDQIGVYLDTFADGRQGFIFYFNALGIQQDIRMSDGTWNVEWDTVLRSRGRLTEDGYELEIAIPFRSLRFPTGGTPQDWGVILTRKTPALGTKYSHPALEPGHPRFFTQACSLQGVEPPKRGSGVELMPVLAVRQSAAREDPDEPFAWSGATPWLDFTRPGLDIRLGLTPDTGVAATVLPDFSQVEGDSARIELNQRFALYYPEQRPFFLDGIDAFQDPQRTLYTRSIVDPLYGVKLSGREDAWSFGVLNALDVNPSASVHEYGTPGFSEDELDGAMAENTYARLSRTTADGGSVGLSVADKWILGPDGAHNTVAGADGNILLADRVTASANTSASVVTGPDQDPMVGLRGSAQIQQASGLGTGWRLGAGGSTSDYRQEMGFLTQTGSVFASGAVDHTIVPELKAVDRVNAIVAASVNTAADGDYKSGATVASALDLAGNHSASAAVSGGSIRVGGVQIPWAWISINYSGTWSAKVRGSAGLGVGEELDYGLLVPARVFRADTSVQWRPTTGTRLDLTAGYQHLVPEGEPVETAATARLRGTWQLTRTLGIRVIGQTVVSNTSDDTDLDLSGLVTWLRSPGTEAYLGATQSFLVNGDSGMLEQFYFFKMSWLFRP